MTRWTSVFLGTDWQGNLTIERRFQLERICAAYGYKVEEVYELLGIEMDGGF